MVDHCPQSCDVPCKLLKDVKGKVWLNFMSFYCFRSLSFLALRCFNPSVGL